MFDGKQVFSVRAPRTSKTEAICRRSMIDKPCRNGALCGNLSDEVFRACLSAIWGHYTKVFQVYDIGARRASRGFLSHVNFFGRNALRIVWDFKRFPPRG